MSDEIQSALVEIVKRTDIDPDRLEKFLDLQIKMEERQAEKAFNQAMASFQGECPIIVKNRKVNFSTVKYDYAALDEIVHIIKPVLQKHGLSYSFNIIQGERQYNLVTSITHKDGHCKKFNYYYDPIHDDARMNASQRRKSAETYAKRGALENALGVVTSGEDDDAQRAHDKPLTIELKSEIKQLIIDTDSNIEGLFSHFGVNCLDDLNLAKAKEAMRMLKTKVKNLEVKSV